ncbi:MAG: toprim domain-containing protein, partial [Candidatus Omnitrophica bacterium]|nr:toprim domain-containing protein [Candidatus Omnitrophota bacterium]
SYIDLFRDRVIFPIFDIRNRVIGFGARLIKDKEGLPKYINSLENPIYSKREHMFGLNFSKDYIMEKNSAIVTEGYLDMITPYSVGIRNIVASLGTALTLEQIRLIKRYTTNVSVVFDADKAGEMATLRALDILLENDLKVKVIRLPEGYDMDLLVRNKGYEFVVSLVENAMDFFDYKISIMKNLYDQESIEGKSKIAEEMLRTINKLSSEIERYEYIKKLSAILKIREEILIAESRKTKNSKFSYEIAKKVNESIPLTEKLLIKFILTNPKSFEMFRKQLTEDDFLYPISKKIFSLVASRFLQDSNLNFQKILSFIEDKEMSSFISQIIIENTPDIDGDILKNCIVRLKNNRIKMIKERLKKQIKEAERINDIRKVKELMLEFKRINSEVRNG